MKTSKAWSVFAVLCIAPLIITGEVVAVNTILHLLSQPFDGAVFFGVLGICLFLLINGLLLYLLKLIFFKNKSSSST